MDNTPKIHNDQNIHNGTSHGYNVNTNCKNAAYIELKYSEYS